MRKVKKKKDISYLHIGLKLTLYGVFPNWKKKTWLTFFPIKQWINFIAFLLAYIKCAK
jgi:hypothetical protein